MRQLMLRAYPRLHLGLTDMSGATRRSYGGAGVAFDGPEVLVEAVAAPGLEVNLHSLDSQSARWIQHGLAAARELDLPVEGRFAISSKAASHIGLGSTTATTLALLQSVARINDWSLPPSQLIDLSGRGRTSAVGCHTFFQGGFVVDVGQNSHRIVDQYLPSLRPAGRSPSLLLGRWPMPPSWSLWLCFTDLQPSVAPETEAAFFTEETPTSSSETLQQLAALYHGVVPAILESNVHDFAASLAEFQQVGFKAREIAAQPAIVQATLAELWARGAAAGLSSLGPTTFIVTDGDDISMLPILDREIHLLGPFRFRNDGHVIAYD